MNWEDLHRNDNTKPVCYISREAAELFDDAALMSLLRAKGVDLRRKTRVTETGAVYYAD